MTTDKAMTPEAPMDSPPMSAPMTPEEVKEARRTERIERAAISYQGVVYDVPRPGRHHDVIRLMASKGYGPECMQLQGFVTSLGRFVDRRIARIIAERQKQIIKTTGPAHMLFSEDVW